MNGIAWTRLLCCFQRSQGHRGPESASSRRQKWPVASVASRESKPAHDGRPHLPQETIDSLTLQNAKHSSEALDHDGLYPELPAPEEEVNMDPDERSKHEAFMREALAEAEYALNHDETPVGCVFVHRGQIIGRGKNDTNRSLNGTRHAEFVAIASILERNTVSVFKETDLYVTVEPCIMCASALRQYGIRRVFFGCANDRFGGTSGVLSIHRDRSIDPPYPAIGGIFREEAIMLLRRFYIQENAKGKKDSNSAAASLSLTRSKAPIPHKKNRVLKEDIPPMQVPKSSFASTPPQTNVEITAQKAHPKTQKVPLAQKIVPAVPILKPRPKKIAPVKAV